MTRGGAFLFANSSILLLTLAPFLVSVGLNYCPCCVCFTQTSCCSLRTPLVPCVLAVPVGLLKSLHVPWGVIVLPDLAVAVNDALPHEFERLLGSLMSLSTFLVLPAALPDQRYFSYWPSLEALVQAAAASSQRTFVQRSLLG